MDEIVKQTRDDKGYTKACSYCGVFRRQALNIGAERTHADVIATGHNADDNAETGNIMNIGSFHSHYEHVPWRHQ